MSEAEQARNEAHARLEQALNRDPEVEAVAAGMARHEDLNNYTRLLLRAMVPEAKP
jgi:hypothetical protein